MRQKIANLIVISPLEIIVNQKIFANSTLLEIFKIKKIKFLVKIILIKILPKLIKSDLLKYLNS
jgi:hypothetical protein